MPDLLPETIRFSGHQKAVTVLTSNEEAAAEIQSKLGLAPYKAVILVFGSSGNFEDKVFQRLTQLCRRGIANAAIDSGAVILDGGINAGVAMLMGAGVASRTTKVSLVGVAPKGKVSFPGRTDAPAGATPLEPNHSHFVLVEGDEWGTETSTLFGLADTLMQAPPRQEAGEQQGSPSARLPRKGFLTPSRQKEEKEQPAKGKKLPALAVLMGGNDLTKNEVVQAVRRRIPLVVVKGSGGLAEDLAAAYDDTDKLPDDPDLAEIIADGEIHMHSLDDLVEGMNRLILRELATDKVLQQAWQTFATYDLNASLQQRWFTKVQAWILGLGVVGTFLAVCSQTLTADFSLFGFQPFRAIDLPYRTILKWILILIPITITALVAASNRFKQGNKWMLLRAGAEAIKREIYKYRVKGYYKAMDPAKLNLVTEEDLKRQKNGTPEQELAQKVEDITRRIMRTEVNSTALRQYTKDEFPPNYGQAVLDDGFSSLTADKYVEVRLNEQLNYYKGKTPKLHRTLLVLTCAILLAGGIGTFLSAIDFPVWIAVTTAVAGMFTTYLGYMQVENTLTKYNQAATDLENVKGWWNALSASEQSMRKNIQLLVDHTEEVLQTELDGWVQQMQDALETLRKDQAKDEDRREHEKISLEGERTGGKKPPPPPPGADPQNNAGNNEPENGAGAVLVTVSNIDTDVAIDTEQGDLDSADANIETGGADDTGQTIETPENIDSEDMAAGNDETLAESAEEDETNAEGEEGPAPTKPPRE